MKSNIKLPSNRKFGLFFGVIFVILSWYFLARETYLLSIFLLILAIIFALLALMKPGILLPLNRVWMKLGELLGKIISPVILGIIFYLIFTPIAIMMRLFGRDELKLKKGKEETYWRDRSPAGPEPSSFKQQF